MSAIDVLMALDSRIANPFFARLLPANPITEISRQEALNRLSPIIHALADPNDPTNGDVPAGYTFFGQFIDHDITLDVSSELGRVINPDTIRNIRTPALDLDCVYGSGPDGSPHIYLPSKKGFLLFGTKDNEYDLSRNCKDVALIGDPRNDENGIVSQIHGYMIQFANLVLQHVSSQGVAGVPNAESLKLRSDNPFEVARGLVRWHYQYVVLHDFLPRFVDPAVFKSVMEAFRNRRLPRPFTTNSPIMPIEFAGAAYRFGHATIQSKYAMNGSTTLELFGPKGIPAFGKKDPAQNIDLELFFDIPGSAKKFQPARRIGLKIAKQLFDLPFVGSGDTVLDDLTIKERDNKSLAHRNIYRDRFTLLLPSGQQVARAMGKSPLEPNKAFKDARIDKVPLWYYILQEGEAHNGKLGWVGGTIVAAVLIRLLVEDRVSVWHHPEWKPVFGADAKPYTLGHLLKWTRENRGKIDFWGDLKCP
ncbi:MAG: peroxidase family protein [Rhodoplanes sp.]